MDGGTHRWQLSGPSSEVGPVPAHSAGNLEGTSTPGRVDCLGPRVKRTKGGHAVLCVYKALRVTVSSDAERPPPQGPKLPHPSWKKQIFCTGFSSLSSPGEANCPLGSLP